MPNAYPAGEESGLKAAGKEQTVRPIQLMDLGLKARELRKPMEGKRSITNPIRVKREALSATMLTSKH